MSYNYTDIHTHILPGIDDGAKTCEEALSILQDEKACGVQTVILTPHYCPGKGNPEAPELRARFESFKASDDVRSLGINLYLGSELLYKDALFRDLKEGRALTMNGTDHVLLEFLPSDSEARILEGVRNMYNGGYKVILAHTERYKYLTMKGIGKLLRMEAELQMNADYVRGLKIALSAKARMHRQLLKEGFVSYIATDAHNASDRKADICAEHIRRHYPDHAEAMLRNNAEKLIRPWAYIF